MSVGFGVQVYNPEPRLPRPKFTIDIPLLCTTMTIIVANLPNCTGNSNSRFPMLVFALLVVPQIPKVIIASAFDDVF